MAGFGKNSLEKLNGVNPLLVKLMMEAIKTTPIDFSIIEGMRTLERQKQLLAEGKSKTLRSNHLVGNAVDICPYVGGKLDWNTEANWKKLTDHIKEVAKKLKIEIVCGIDWKTFHDAPHIELKK